MQRDELQLNLSSVPKLEKRRKNIIIRIDNQLPEQKIFICLEVYDIFEMKKIKTKTFLSILFKLKNSNLRKTL